MYRIFSNQISRFFFLSNTHYDRCSEYSRLILPRLRRVIFLIFHKDTFFLPYGRNDQNARILQQYVILVFSLNYISRMHISLLHISFMTAPSTNAIVQARISLVLLNLHGSLFLMPFSLRYISLVSATSTNATIP